ncbi:MAG: KGK domain-containing protein [Xenococcus sp. MO_188.B8]|nr:KGK domain-containing protein [Xenococcus sp. MO_188.B8]
MNTNNNFKQLEHEQDHLDTVVSFDNGTTFKVSKLMQQLNKFFQQSVLYKLPEKLMQVGLGTPPDYRNNWTSNVKAEILEPQSGKWKKGKVRMRVVLEFCPDEPEEVEITNNSDNNNSLDDIRKHIDITN